MPPKELDMNIARYYMSVKHNTTNKDLESWTLKGMQCSIKRYLSDKDFPHDIMTDKLFNISREMLRDKGVDLKEKGLGNRAKRADPFTRDEIQMIYQKQLLGSGKSRNLKALTDLMSADLSVKQIVLLSLAKIVYISPCQQGESL
ncbi:hypothetical protein DPMN_143634 [Dreissena polymorpha]|uniref:Uncharacterized protein n=1 Tax=Dreissena polymorpha TaxID=45954 RepID=A0A9D4GGQ3_DREPO|nr:hypothetical protein DPMN_143634 [Dreissena polymorpha]